MDGCSFRKVLVLIAHKQLHHFLPRIILIVIDFFFLINLILKEGIGFINLFAIYMNNLGNMLAFRLYVVNLCGIELLNMAYIII